MWSHGDAPELVGVLGVSAPVALGVVAGDATPSSEFLEYYHLREEERGKEEEERRIK